jgi:hypothetical protein
VEVSTDLNYQDQRRLPHQFSERKTHLLTTFKNQVNHSSANPKEKVNTRRARCEHRLYSLKVHNSFHYKPPTPLPSQIASCSGFLPSMLKSPPRTTASSTLATAPKISLIRISSCTRTGAPASLSRLPVIKCVPQNRTGCFDSFSLNRTNASARRFCALPGFLDESRKTFLCLTNGKTFLCLTNGSATW